MRKVVAFLLLVAIAGIGWAWWVHLVDDRILTIAIGLAGLVSLVLIDVPSLMRSRRSNKK